MLLSLKEHYLDLDEMSSNSYINKYIKRKIKKK